MGKHSDLSGGFARRVIARGLSILLGASSIAVFVGAEPAHAAAALTVTPITWDVIGLDSNKVSTGPNVFPVGQRICNTGDATASGVTATFSWDDSTNASLIYTQPGTLTTVSVGDIAVDQCKDAYFNIEISRNSAAYDKTRKYRVTATDGSVSGTSPTPRQIYVEHLVSQNRNATLDIAVDGVTIPGGTVKDLVIGGTYLIRLTSATTTQGYEQLETFLGMPNNAFQIESVTTTYSANSSPYVSSPSSTFYADACRWDPVPTSPTYRTCVGGTYKTGGNNIVTTYSVRIIGGAGTYTLYPMLYDFSGSSFHYNSDFASASRVVRIVEPIYPSFTKSFSPNPIAAGQTSTLTFTITNTSTSPVNSITFTDTFPSGMTVATDPAISYGTGCTAGSTLTGAGAATSVAFTGGVEASSSCVISVDVTAASANVYPNTTSNLLIGGTDTKKSASDTLLVTSAGSGTCSGTQTSIASWDFASGLSPTAPGVGTATANVPLQSSTSGVWKTWGYKDQGQFASFQIQNNSYLGLLWTFTLGKGSSWPNPYLFKAEYAIDAGSWQQLNGVTIATGVNTLNFSSALASAGATATLKFRIYGTATSNNDSQGYLSLDEVSFTGCSTAIAGAAVPSAEFSKSFTPDTIKIAETSTLTFAIKNTGETTISNVSFDDRFPNGITVASMPGVSYGAGCSAGTLTAPADSTSVAFSGGTIAAGATCTISVNVKGTTAGPWTNQTDFLKIDGSTVNLRASAPITVVDAPLPPILGKSFNRAAIAPGESSTLTFTIINPNASTSLNGISFSDSLPSGLTFVGSETNSGCGGAVSKTTTTFTFSGGTLADGATCSISIAVTGTTAAEYTNTTSAVTATGTAPGNSATALLLIQAKKTALDLTKQVYVATSDSSAPNDSSPWLTVQAWTDGEADIWYRFTVTNSGETTISDPSITDPSLGRLLPGACSSLPTSLAPGDSASCIIGPIAWDGVNPVSNIATASGRSGGRSTTSRESSTRTGGAQITLTKRAVPRSFWYVGQEITYLFKVENTGGVVLEGPVTVTDDRIAEVVCPPVSTSQTGPESNPSGGSGGDLLLPGEWIICVGTDVVREEDGKSITNRATATIANGEDPKTSEPKELTIRYGFAISWNGSVPWDVTDPLEGTELPGTGRDSTSSLLVALLLVSIGAMCVVVARRRVLS